MLGLLSSMFTRERVGREFRDRWGRGVFLGTVVRGMLVSIGVLF